MNGEVWNIIITALFSLFVGLIIGRYSWWLQMHIVKPNIRYQKAKGNYPKINVPYKTEFVIMNLSEPYMIEYKRYYRIQYSDGSEVKGSLMVPDEAGYISKTSKGIWVPQKFSNHFIDNPTKYVKKVFGSFPLRIQLGASIVLVPFLKEIETVVGKS